MIAEGELKRALGKIRLTREIKQLNGHVISCGYGRSGSVLAGQLFQAGVAVVVVDNDEQRCERAAKSGYLPLQGDASHDATLSEAGIDKARALCTVLPNDAMNVFITLTARNLNREISIIARGEYPETEPKLIQAGATRVVLPSATSAIHMADIITRPFALDYLQDSELSALDKDLQKLGLQMLTLALDETAQGRTVGDLEKEADVSLMVVALLRTTGEKQESPALEEPLHPGDRVVLIAHVEHAHSISLKFSGGRRLSYRGVSVRQV
jgi:voltage-gated potassium channel